MANTKNTKTFADTMAIRRPDADGLDAMFPATEQAAATPSGEPSGDGSASRPQKQKGVGRYANQITNTKDGRQQMAFKLPVETVEQIRRMSYWERVEQWQFVADAIQAAVAKYEKTHGELKPIPDR
ncbi:MAG: hypothetical protein IIW86_04120 [Clostridia bacterium]|nr:hypothetical protein [Clostridia bacterium]